MKITKVLSVLVLVAVSCYAQAPTIIQPTDTVSSSRGVINTNFQNLYNQIITGIISSPNQIIFNNGGVPGGSNNLQWDNVAQVGNVAGRWNISGILNVGGQVTLGSLGTGILHSSSSGVISSSLINLAGSDVTGNLPVTHLNSGIGATGTNCWRGDGTWGACGNQSTFTTTDYNFSAQTPGVSLGVGNTTITISPVPSGVSGTDTSHTLLVQGGIGTAESCLITGGTAVSNTPSGTLILNCSHTHTGNWTISSATNGGEEAYQIVKAGGVGGQIFYPAGIWVNCGTLTVDTDSIIIYGAGSGGTGLISPSTPGITGTQIQPCFAGQTMFSSPSGHVYFSNVNRLSMHDMGFSNAGLSGITAISLVHDVAGIFTNLSFYGSASAFTGISADRVWASDFSNIHSAGTEGSFFGSTVDSDIAPNWSYSTVHILHWDYLGNGTVKAAMTLQRCVSCSLAHSRFSDTQLVVTGAAVVVANDSQGSELDDVVVEGFLNPITLTSSTVGTTVSAPGWTTLANIQIDCAGGAACDAAGQVQIKLNGAYYTQILNPTLSAVTSSGTGIQVFANTFSLPSVDINGGTYSLTNGTQINIRSTSDRVEIHNGIFNGNTGGAAIFLSGGGAVNNVLSTGNHFSNGAPMLSIAAGGTTLINSLFSGNSCSTGAVSSGCNSLAYIQIPGCSNNLAGTFQTIVDANTNTWGATVSSGGGANVVGLHCDGANWTVYAK